MHTMMGSEVDSRLRDPRPHLVSKLLTGYPRSSHDEATEAGEDDTNAEGGQQLGGKHLTGRTAL